MLRYWYKKRLLQKKQAAPSFTYNPNSPKKKISKDVSRVERNIKQIFGDTTDFHTEDIHIGQTLGKLCFLSSMVEANTVTDKIVEPLMNANVHELKVTSEKEWERYIKDVFPGTKYSVLEKEEDVIRDILNGYVILLVGGQDSALSIKAMQQNKRGIEEPSTQTIIRGSKEGFIEDIDTNISLLRKRIRNPQLRFESYIIGSETKTSVALAYIDGIVNSGIIEEARTRLKKIKTNAVFESANIEEFIVDKTITPFPLVNNTERPDTVSAHLIAGKVAIIIDGSPFVLTAPAIINDFLSISEDYYQPFMMGSFVRILRYVCFLLALLLPSFYVALITYHHDIIPTALIATVIAQREGIPFPAVVEALGMELTFEILREAGIRMPRAVGGTISIVGGLVIGQAAVEAGIVSNIMVIIVALTAIASFVSPVYSFSVASRLLRFVFIILASIFGLYGVLLGLIFMVGHMASLRSFGIPYLAPFAPFVIQDQADAFFRLPIWVSKKRPKSFRTEDPDKQPLAESPTPPSSQSGGGKQ